MKTKEGNDYSLKKVLATLIHKKRFLFDEFGVIDLAVFGSYAKNEQKKDSDIDIYVVLKKEYKTFDNFMDLKFYLEELLSNKRVDLVIKDSIRRELKPKIIMEAVHV